MWRSILPSSVNPVCLISQIFSHFPTNPYHSPQYLLLLDHIVDKAPVARGTVADTNGIYSKLTNTTLYTGTHKNRFDDAGVGKGAAGRVQPTGTVTLGTVVNRGSVTGAGATGTGSAKKRGQTNVVTASSERLDLVSSKPKKVDTHASNSSLSTAAKKSTVVVVEAKPKAPVASRPIARPASASKTGRTSVGATGGSGVFDRLTNVSSYTGTHKSRFNADGTGRGIVGRDAPSLGSSPGKYRGGDVKDLSQILRS